MNNLIETSDNTHIQIDPRLDEYNDKILFPEKVEKAKAVMSKVGLPKGKSKTVKHTKSKPFTSLQKELLSIYALEPTAKEMEELKVFMHNLFEKKLVELVH
jgi:hypothetical protein